MGECSCRKKKGEIESFFSCSEKKVDHYTVLVNPFQKICRSCVKLSPLGTEVKNERESEREGAIREVVNGQSTCTHEGRFFLWCLGSH